MVVYDPNDPHADLYDVDDGERSLHFDVLRSQADHWAESTVITLSDWYHTAAKLGPAFP